MPPDPTSYSSNILQFLKPDNPVALVVVTLLQIAFVAWVIKLWLSLRKLRLARNQLQALSDVSFLVGARQAHSINSTEEVDVQQVFTEYIRQKLDDVLDPIATHLKTIFLAGWNEGRLEVGELIRHTSQQLFEWHQVLRAALATFIVMGLLGTLFGLADSLAGLAPIIQNKTAAGLGTGTSEHILSGLSNLLGDLKSAFAPSIWGVAFTIMGIMWHSLYIRIYAMPVQQILEALTLTVWVPQLYPTRSQALQETMEKSFDAAQKVARVAETIESGTEEFSKNLETANSMTKLFSQAATKLDAASETIDKTFAEHFVKHSEEFSTGVKTLSGFERELKSLYQQMQQGAEDFRRVYGETLDKQSASLETQNSSLESVVTSLKSYETAYIVERKNIDAQMKRFLDEATEASTSVSKGNRELIEKLSALLVDELSKLPPVLTDKLGKVQEAMDVGFDALNGAFEKLRQPFDNTANKIEYTFEHFDNDIREIIHKDIIAHFKMQNEQNKVQLDNIQGLNTNIKELLALLAENSKNQAAQLNRLSDTLTLFTPALVTFGSTLKSLSGDMQNVVHAVNQIKSLKSYNPQAAPEKKSREEVRTDRKHKKAPPTLANNDKRDNTNGFVTRVGNWLRSVFMEDDGINHTLSQTPVSNEIPVRKAEEVVVVSDADLKMQKIAAATSDTLLQETDNAETSTKKVEEVVVVNDTDLKLNDKAHS